MPFSDAEIRTFIDELFRTASCTQTAGPLYGLKVASDAIGRAAEREERAIAAAEAAEAVRAAEADELATAEELRQADAEIAHHVGLDYHVEGSAPGAAVKLRVGYPIQMIVTASNDLRACVGAYAVTLVAGEWTVKSADVRDMACIYAAYRLSHEWHHWPAGDRRAHAYSILRHVRDTIVRSFSTSPLLGGYVPERASDDELQVLAQAYDEHLDSYNGKWRHPFPPSVSEQLAKRA